MLYNKSILAAWLICGISWTSCKTLESGGKVVDKGRGEIIISSPANQMSALPDGSKDKSLTKARERLEQMVKESPKDTRALVSLAQLQMAQDRLSEAEETGRKVLLIDTKNQGARKVLAQVAIRRENYDMALIFLSALGGEESKDSDVSNMLGIIALARGDNTEAVRLWKQALSINPGDISARMNMGVMYIKNRLFAQASTQFERILKVAPNHQDARLHLAIIETSRGKNAEALEVFKAILADDRDNTLALFNMAVAQRNLNQYDDAVASLKRYIKASPAKSTFTDEAFAMIDEINTIQTANNQKVSDEDLQSLAKDLASRKAQAKADQTPTDVVDQIQKPEAQDSSGKPVAENEKKHVKENSQQTVARKAADASKAIEKAKEPTVTDSEIEALEKQLKSPAH